MAMDCWHLALFEHKCNITAWAEYRHCHCSLTDTVHFAHHASMGQLMAENKTITTIRCDTGERKNELPGFFSHATCGRRFLFSHFF